MAPSKSAQLLAAMEACSVSDPSPLPATAATAQPKKKKRPSRGFILDSDSDEEEETPKISIRRQRSAPVTTRPYIPGLANLVEEPIIRPVPKETTPPRVSPAPQALPPPPPIIYERSISPVSSPSSPPPSTPPPVIKSEPVTPFSSPPPAANVPARIEWEWWWETSRLEYSPMDWCDDEAYLNNWDYMKLWEDYLGFGRRLEWDQEDKEMKDAWKTQELEDALKEEDGYFYQ